MASRRVHDYTTAALHLFSFTALLPLLVVFVRGVAAGRLPAPEPDEGTGAHVFQLSIAALLPIGVAFLASADWNRPAALVRRLALPTMFVVLAFGMLYYYEHVAVF